MISADFCSIKELKATKLLWDRILPTRRWDRWRSKALSMKFLEPPGFIIVHRTKEIENCPRRCILSGIHGYFYTAERDIRKEEVLCSRAKVIGDIHTCLRFRFLAVLNIERAGRVRPYVGRGCFATWRFHFDTLHSCRPLDTCPISLIGHPLKKWIVN